jgi:Sigma-70 region 2
MASDAELIDGSLNGNVDAFMTVVDRHEVAVGSYLARRAGRDAAEDLIGEVWVAAFESRRSYDQLYADARPWLYGVALNRLRHYGNPLVRQGVLRLLSTISGVSVAHSTTNGKATLTITAGPEVFNGDGSEVLTIDARTGMLVKDVSNTSGTPTAYTTYQSSRVTTAHL